MYYHYHPRAIEQLEVAPVSVQHAFYRKVQFLTVNLRHPSLRAKKYGGARSIWQARITKGWRFYFLIDGDRYIILSISPHPK